MGVWLKVLPFPAFFFVFGDGISVFSEIPFFTVFLQKSR